MNCVKRVFFFASARHNSSITDTRLPAVHARTQVLPTDCDGAVEFQWMVLSNIHGGASLLNPVCC